MNFYHDKAPLYEWNGSVIYHYEDDQDVCAFSFVPTDDVMCPGKTIFFLTNWVTSKESEMGKYSFLNFPLQTYTFHKDVPFHQILNYGCKERWNRNEEPHYESPLKIYIYEETDEVKNRMDIIKSLSIEQLKAGYYEKLREEADNFDPEAFAQEMSKYLITKSPEQSN